MLLLFEFIIHNRCTLDKRAYNRDKIIVQLKRTPLVQKNAIFGSTFANTCMIQDAVSLTS